MAQRLYRTFLKRPPGLLFHPSRGRRGYLPTTRRNANGWAGALVAFRSPPAPPAAPRSLSLSRILISKAGNHQFQTLRASGLDLGTRAVPRFEDSQIACQGRPCLRAAQTITPLFRRLAAPAHLFGPNLAPGHPAPA